MPQFSISLTASGNPSGSFDSNDIFVETIGTQLVGITVVGHDCAYQASCGPFSYDQGTAHVYIQIEADTEFTAGSGTYNCDDGAGNHAMQLIYNGFDAYIYGLCQYDNLNASHAATVVIDF